MKILLATDGSDFSKAAIDALANIVAKPDATSLKIISVVERPTPIAAEPFAVSAEYYNAIEEGGANKRGNLSNRLKRKFARCFQTMRSN